MDLKKQSYYEKEKDTLAAKGRQFGEEFFFLDGRNLITLVSPKEGRI